MCNPYSMTRAREAMLRLSRVSNNRAAAIKPKAAIIPGYVAPRERPCPKKWLVVAKIIFKT